jgi:hypothetical protein
MRWVLVGVLCCCAGTLSACVNQLSKTEVELLDAVMFALYGIEDKTTDHDKMPPWRRQAIGWKIEFSRITENHIGSSSEEKTPKFEIAGTRPKPSI